MKIKLSLLLIAQIMISSTLFAQSKIGFLKKGDRVPPSLSLGKIINYKTSTAKISDFKNKLIILDFWATYCSSCIAGLPRMDSLQKKFGNKIAIIPIDYEESKIVQDYFKKKRFKLPSVVEDRTLNQIFPQLALDMHVWIDETGRIIATTGGEEVTSNKIAEYFKIGKLNVKERIDAIGIYDRSMPLFVHGNGGDYTPIYQSVLSDPIEGATGVTRGFDFINNDALNFYFNSPYSDVYYLYKYAFSLMNAKNSFCTRFYVEKDGHLESVIDYYKQGETVKSIEDSLSSLLNKKKYVSYSITVPRLTANDEMFFRQYMLEDLNRYFKYKAEIKKLKIPSWIIINANNGKGCLALKNDTSHSQIVFDDQIEQNYIKRIQNMEFKNFMTLFTGVGRDIHMYHMTPPAFNETGYETERINLDLGIKYTKDKAYAKPMNLEEWRAALQRNGLDIKVEDREVEVMVFKKKETPAK